MGPVSGVVVYLCIWWTALFAVLPWGVRQPDAPIEGVVGAPVAPNLKAKFIATTIVSAIIWIIIELMFIFDVVDFRAIGDAVQY
jgi:predicted secreted protein